MSGHSKWSQIKRQKGANDAKRGQLFTRLGREITVAARDGGGDPDANYRLRLAMQRARESNMPMENIERAIKRGTGGGEGAALDEIVYEGYGPGGAAVLVEVMTDNRNRAAGEVRNVFSRHGGNLGNPGSVNWMFEPRGIITLAVNGADAEEIELKAIDAGATDVTAADGEIEVQTDPTDLDAVRLAFEGDSVTIISAETTLIPKQTVDLDGKQAMQVLKLVDKLEELDDVQHVYTNTEFSDEVLAEYSGS
jgi:YebC/PmpR family DNA-binding regulatory protein